jgi:hypothetical protein
MSALLEMAMLIRRDEATSDCAADVSVAVPTVGTPGARTQQPIVSMHATRVGDRRIEVSVVIDPRYHLHDTNVDPQLGLHATRLRVAGQQAELVDFIDYPPAKLLSLPYGPPVAAYSGNVHLTVTFTGPMPEEPIELSLSYQACDEAMCLRPAVVTTQA